MTALYRTYCRRLNLPRVADINDPLSRVIHPGCPARPRARDPLLQAVCRGSGLSRCVTPRRWLVPAAAAALESGSGDVATSSQTRPSHVPRELVLDPPTPRIQRCLRRPPDGRWASWKRSGDHGATPPLSGPQRALSRAPGAGRESGSKRPSGTASEAASETGLFRGLLPGLQPRLQPGCCHVYNCPCRSSCSPPCNPRVGVPGGRCCPGLGPGPQRTCLALGASHQPPLRASESVLPSERR